MLAGACFALGSVLQHHAARRVATHPLGDPRLLLRLLRRPLWLFGRMLALAGFAVQALALRYGPLSYVQPLMVSGMFLSVPLEARLDRRPANHREVRAVLIAGLGLAVFLIAAAPTSGDSRPADSGWAAVLAVTAGLVALCLVATRSHPAGTGTYLGVATGIVFGVTAALLKTGVTSLDRGPVHLLTDWALYALVGTIALGLVLSQNAFQSGSLAAPLTAFTLTEPIIAMGIGVGAFHEHIDTAGPHAALIALGFAAMAVGVRQLSERPTDPGIGAIGPTARPAG